MRYYIICLFTFNISLPIQADSLPAQVSTLLGRLAFTTLDCVDYSNKEIDNGVSCTQKTNVALEKISSEVASVRRVAYIAALSAERAANDSCAIGFVEMKMDKGFPSYAEKTRKKVQSLVEAVHGLMSLQHKLASASKDKQVGLRKELEKAVAQVTLLENSIPLKDESAIRDLVMSYVEKAVPSSFVNPVMPPAIETQDFQEKLEKAMKKARVVLMGDKEVFEKGSKDPEKLDNTQKEILAQDYSLVKNYHLANPKLNLTQVACDVDARYGIGAKRRDQVVMGATIAASLLSMGAGTVARGALALANTNRAIAAGRFSQGLSLIALIGEGYIAKDAIVKSCGDISDSNVKTKSGNSKDRCQDFSIENSEISDCQTVEALMALGFTGTVFNGLKAQKIVNDAKALDLARKEALKTALADSKLGYGKSTESSPSIEMNAPKKVNLTSDDITFEIKTPQGEVKRVDAKILERIVVDNEEVAYKIQFIEPKTKKVRTGKLTNKQLESLNPELNNKPSIVGEISTKDDPYEEFLRLQADASQTTEVNKLQKIQPKETINFESVDGSDALVIKKSVSPPTPPKTTSMPAETNPNQVLEQFQSNYINVIAKDSMGMTGPMRAELMETLIKDGKQYIQLRILDTNTQKLTTKTLSLHEFKLLKPTESKDAERAIKQFRRSNFSSVD